MGSADLLAGVKLSQAVLQYEHTCSDVPNSSLGSSIFFCETIQVFRHTVRCIGIPAIMNTSSIVQIIF